MRYLTFARLAVLGSPFFFMVGCGNSGTPGGAGAAFGVISQAAQSPITRTGAYLTDDQGRVVVFHGVNIIRKLAPYWPDTRTAADAALLADEGFNVARIGWIWAAAEPTPGSYDDAYLAHLLDFNQLLGRYGIRSFVDFHQDEWSQSAGGDGAPEWATLESSYLADWQDFWNDKAAADGTGIQTRFDALWTHAAGLITASPGSRNVMGIDPINEPNPGSGYPACAPTASCTTFETTQLTEFYQKVTPAIRKGGDGHVVWIEDEPDHTAFTPVFTSAAFSDPQTAYSWHYYCVPTEETSDPGGAFDAFCDAQTSKAMANETAFGTQMQVPELIGEFGANGADEEYAKQVDAFDAAFASWTYWLYYIPTGDPADPAAGSILVDSTQPGSESNADQTKLDALVVPYPQAIAGTPQSYSYDRATGAMTLTYSPAAVPGATLAAHALTQIFVPRRQYPTGYQVSVTGATQVSGASSPWVELQSVVGATQVTVTVAPTTTGTTPLPSQTGVYPLSGP